MTVKYKKILYPLFGVFLCLSLCSCFRPNNISSQIPSQYVEAVMAYKNTLKDPTSMRIYGDVLVLSMTEEDVSSISIVCDGKNSYGGYGGKTTVEIMLILDSAPFWLTEDSKDFKDIRHIYDVYNNLSEEKKKEYDTQMKFEVISGAELAQKIGAEYYSD